MTPTEARGALTRAVDDQPFWNFNRQHGYAYHLHGRHIAVVQATPAEVTPDWRYSVRDVLTGHATEHGARDGDITILLEELNVGLTEAERKYRERLRDDRS